MNKKTILFLLGLALLIFWLSIFYVGSQWNQVVKEVEVNQKVIQLDIIDYSKYSCPPNLSAYQCETFIRTALVNGFDVEEFLLSRYKHN